MAKSTKVINHVLHPYDNIMIIERRYIYEKGHDAKRPQVRLPKSVKLGWHYIGTEKEDYLQIGNDGCWTIREIYIKDKHIFDLPKKI